MKFDVQGNTAYAYTGGRPLVRGQPLLVLIHGAQHDHSVWGLQSRYLAHNGWSMLALDLPGHGRSAGPALPGIEQLAAWVCEAVPAACAAAGLGAVPPAVLGGHSMGSLIALEATALRPAWLTAIALVATAIPMRVSDALLDAARDDEQRAFDMINFWSSAGINHHPGTPGPGFSTYVQNLRLMERQQPGVLRTDFNACNAYASGLARAKALTLPVLFLLAGRDQMTPPKAAAKAIDAVRAAGADVAVVVVDGSGHNVMAEHPDETLGALRDWLTRLPAATMAGGAAGDGNAEGGNAADGNAAEAGATEDKAGDGNAADGNAAGISPAGTVPLR
jgi:pimeloyl-ACP methyl ester carboxylesterase